MAGGWLPLCNYSLIIQCVVKHIVFPQAKIKNTCLFRVQSDGRKNINRKMKSTIFLGLLSFFFYLIITTTFYHVVYKQSCISCESKKEWDTISIINIVGAEEIRVSCCFKEVVSSYHIMHLGQQFQPSIVEKITVQNIL